MKKLFFICNAHIDPVWQWEWPEGAAAAISTFRTAADFCEEYEGFVFCHNEALLYQWVEEYDLPLFRRIQELVRQGKWYIMGGWFLQPDCNLPSGESILRQIITGQQYFREKFQSAPTCAVSFDAFGHSRGLVQILSQCGYDAYLFMRPEADKLPLENRNFVWEGVDGSQVIGRRLDKGYLTPKGKAVSDLESWVENNQNEEISMFTWGVGNHGGGPSRIDWTGLRQWIENNLRIESVQATPEDYFRALRESGAELPHFDRDLRTVFMGCYTSQARLKRLHCRLENELFAVEKLMSSAAGQKLCPYPAKELMEAQRDLLISEFHDTLPGTTIAPVEEASMHTLGHGMEILSRLKTRGFMALLSGQKKAGEGEIPIFVYNPHPYEVTGDFTCEFMPADQNWSTTYRNAVVVRHNGRIVPSQEEKEDSMLNLDWRKRVVFHGTLQPYGMTRFDCTLEAVPCDPWTVPVVTEEPVVFCNERVRVEISRKTGLVDCYRVDGIDYLKPGSLAAVLREDNADPWYMAAKQYGPERERFSLMTPAETARFFGSPEQELPPVRIVEDGAVRMVVEAVFRCGSSVLVQTYRMSRHSTELEVEQRIIWNEQDRIMKLEIPTVIADGTYWGQGMYAATELFQDGTECVSQRWCGLFGADRALTVVTHGTYGSHCQDGTLFLSLVRAPGYCVHPIGERPLYDTNRYLPRMDRGEHVLHFVLSGGEADQRRASVDAEAQRYHEAPYALNVFPSGLGDLPQSFLTISDPAVLLSAAYMDEASGKQVIRLWNSSGVEKTVTVCGPVWRIAQEVTLPAYRFQTFCVDLEEGLQPVDPVTLQKATVEA